MTTGLIAYYNRISSHRMASTAFLLVLSVPIVFALVGNRDPWLDEAMLAVNFIEMKLNDLTDPMPLYDQAAPIAHILLAKTALLLSGTQNRFNAMFALRLLSALIATVGFAFLIRLARDKSSEASTLTFAALLLTSPYIIRYATEIKPYVFDFTATSIVVYTAAGIARSGQMRDFVKFLLVSFIACLLSFVAVIPIFACLTAAAVARLVSAIWPQQQFQGLRPTGPSITLTDLWRFFAFGGGSVLIAVAFYLLFSRGMTELNAKSYPDLFAEPFIGLNKSFSENISILWRLPKFLVAFWSTSATFSRVPDIVEPHLYYQARYLLAWTLLAMIVITSSLCALQHFFIAMSFFAALALVVALNAIHVFPLVERRFLSFIAPLLFLSIGLGLFEGYRRLRPYLVLRLRAVIQLVGAMLLAIFYGVGFNFATTDLALQEDRSMLARIRSDGQEDPVWAYWGRQPAMRLLAPNEFHEVGQFDPTSSSKGWFLRGGEYSRSSSPPNPNPWFLAKVQRELSNYSKVWLLLESELLSPSEPYLAAAENAVGHCGLVKSGATNDRLYFCSAVANK